MDVGRRIAISAIAGLLAAACGGAQPAPRAPAPGTDVPAAGAENGCGNHDGGACGAMDPAPPATSGDAGGKTSG